MGGAVVALVLLGAVVLANSMNGGGREETPSAVSGVGGSPPATATTAIAGGAIETATATATDEPIPTVPAPTEIRLTTPVPSRTPTVEPTAEPTSTATTPATSTPEPTETAAPTATAPPSPTATPPPSPTPTPLPPTPSPTAVPVDDGADDASEPPSGGVGSGSASGSSAPAGNESFTIPADAWVGGEFRADISGGPAVVLTRGGNNDRASVSFVLDQIPAAGLTLELTGFEVVTDRPAEIEIEVNGRRVWEGESPFAAGGGAAWIAVELELPADDFRVGENEVSVRFRPPGGSDGDDAGLALRGVRLLPAASATDAGSGVVEAAVPVDENAGAGSADGEAGSEGDGDPEAAPTIAPRDGG